MKKKRGFASMTAEQRSAIASMGGKAVPADRRSFSQDRDLAASAGKKGGESVDPDKRAFSIDPDLASAAGRKSRKPNPIK